MDMGAGLTRSDVVSVFEAEKKVVAMIIEEGGAVNTELFNVFPSISWRQGGRGLVLHSLGRRRGGQGRRVGHRDKQPLGSHRCCPPLTTGTYHIKIVTQFSSSGKYLKSPHTFTFEKDLTVS
jgi:hypothetical protein